MRLGGPTLVSSHEPGVQVVSWVLFMQALCSARALSLSLSCVASSLQLRKTRVMHTACTTLPVPLPVEHGACGKYGGHRHHSG